MIGRLLIERWSEDRLSVTTWIFVMVYDTRLWLAEYIEARRPTRRHKPVPVRWYDRYARRGDSPLTLKDCPVPDEIIDEAKQQLMNMIKYEEAPMTPNERKEAAREIRNSPEITSDLCCPDPELVEAAEQKLIAILAAHDRVDTGQSVKEVWHRDGNDVACFHEDGPECVCSCESTRRAEQIVNEHNANRPIDPEKLADQLLAGADSIVVVCLNAEDSRDAQGNMLTLREAQHRKLTAAIRQYLEGQDG